MRHPCGFPGGGVPTLRYALSSGRIGAAADAGAAAPGGGVSPGAWWRPRSAASPGQGGDERRRKATARPPGAGPHAPTRDHAGPPCCPLAGPVARPGCCPWLALPRGPGASWGPVVTPRGVGGAGGEHMLVRNPPHGPENDLRRAPWLSVQGEGPRSGCQMSSFARAPGRKPGAQPPPVRPDAPPSGCPRQAPVRLRGW